MTGLALAGRVWRFWLVPFATLGVVVAASQARAAGCTYGQCAPGNTVINSAVVKQSSQTVNNLLGSSIGNALSGALGGGPGSQLGQQGTTDAGMAAGSQPSGTGLWVNAGGDWIQGTKAGANFNGPITATLAGVGFKPTDQFMLGVAVGYEGIDLATPFNSGHVSSNGLDLSPYAAFAISPNWNILGYVGHSWIGYNENHSGGVSGSFNGSRWFAAISLNNQATVENWHFGSSLGYSYVTEAQNAYTESNGNPVPRATVFGGSILVQERVSYPIQMSWGALVPYGLLRLDFDVGQSAAPVINSFGQTADYGSFGATFGLGVDALINGDWTIGLAARTTQFRPNFQSYGLTLTLRKNF
jgi:hypothetical protein